MSVASGFGRVTLTAVGSGRWPRGGRRCCAPLASWRVAIALPVAACSYSPTMDLLGSYFPAWMLCAVIGIVASVIIRQILVVSGINDYVVAPLLTYAAFAVSATLLAWLLWFGH
jgi:YtcA family